MQNYVLLDYLYHWLMLKLYKSLPQETCTSDILSDVCSCTSFLH